MVKAVEPGNQRTLLNGQDKKKKKKKGSNDKKPLGW
jgi:hypothetical protein